jgi:hypothetical protein
MFNLNYKRCIVLGNVTRLLGVEGLTNFEQHSL